LHLRENSADGMRKGRYHGVAGKPLPVADPVQRMEEGAHEPNTAGDAVGVISLGRRSVETLTAVKIQQNPLKLIDEAHII